MMKDNNLESTFKNKANELRTEVRPKLWDKLEKRMDDHYASTTHSTKIVSMYWFRYAAAFILLLGAGFVLSRLDTTPSSPMAYQFTLEEMSTPVEEDQMYKEMIEFSQKHYQMLINPGAKQNPAM